MAEHSTETLLFLHIPKAAGTTLSRVVERHVTPSRQYRLGANAQAAIERFNTLPESKRARYRLLSGHFPYGVHEQVPGPHAYFTLLRDPVDRVASFYHFVRRDPRHYLNEQMTPAQKASLLDFATSTSCPTVDNGQTRQLAGDWGRVPFGECGPGMLETAKRNLETFAVVGLTERFDASLMLLGQRFGWTRLGYRKANQTRKRPPTSSIDPETRTALENLSTLDRELYDFAKTLFDSQWQASGFDETRFAELHPPPSPAMDLYLRLTNKVGRCFA